MVNYSHSSYTVWKILDTDCYWGNNMVVLRWRFHGSRHNICQDHNERPVNSFLFYVFQYSQESYAHIRLLFTEEFTVVIHLRMFPAILQLQASVNTEKTSIITSEYVTTNFCKTCLWLNFVTTESCIFRSIGTLSWPILLFIKLSNLSWPQLEVVGVRTCLALLCLA